MEKDLRKKLGIDDWLELVKEDRNCNGAYISFGQYMYLLEKDNQELKKQLEVGKEQYNDLVEEKEKIQEQLSSNTLQFENQQKEFIEWLQANLEALIMCDREFILTNNKKGIKAYSEILSKYKEIIGGSNDKTNKKLGRIKQSSSKR